MASIRNFVSRITPTLLHSFIKRHSIELSPTELAASPTKVTEAIDRALEQLPVGARGRLLHEIETVEKLATEVGERAIASATLHENLGELPSRHARALWVFLNDPEGFHRAEESVHHDAQRYSRQWTPFAGQKGCDLRRDHAAQEAFKAALRVQFDTPNVHLDIFDRSRSSFFDGNAAGDDEDKVDLVQITIYREDRPNVEPAFVENKFAYQTRSRVIEAAVTYEPASGRIECVAAQRANREAVVAHFSTIMLGCAPELVPFMMRSYDLSVLADRVDFRTDPIDLIDGVSVAMLRLSPSDGTSDQVTIERLAESGRDIWEVAEERLGKNALATSYRISQARIAIRYRAHGSNRRQTLQVMITHPYKSNIKDQRAIERVVAGKYLSRWGLVVGQ